ncbi:hypothetical protein WH5701_08339 [Synechococcus sp. WH 5701]|nr:hypothetical protein WH5701_08339 [Synechococcus sp. WH 5701]
MLIAADWLVIAVQDWTGVMGGMRLGFTDSEQATDLKRAN